MNFEEYKKYSSCFTGKADVDFESKFFINESRGLSAEKAFFEIDTFGKKPNIFMTEKTALLEALKGKAAFNLLVKQVSEQIKLAHKEKWVWIIGKVSFDQKIKNYEVYPEIIQSLLECSDDRVFSAAWKQAKVSVNQE